MKDQTEITNKNVIEMIKTINLYPKALDVLIDTFIKQAAILGKNPLENGSKAEMRSLFTSDIFLSRFTKRYKEIFTNEEIASLLAMYRSQEMKKVLENGKELFEPLYHAMREEIEKISERSVAQIS